MKVKIALNKQGHIGTVFELEGKEIKTENSANEYTKAMWTVKVDDQTVHFLHDDLLYIKIDGGDTVHNQTAIGSNYSAEQAVIAGIMDARAVYGNDDA